MKVYFARAKGSKRWKKVMAHSEEEAALKSVIKSRKSRRKRKKPKRDDIFDMDRPVFNGL